MEKSTVSLNSRRLALPGLCSLMHVSGVLMCFPSLFMLSTPCYSNSVIPQTSDPLITETVMVGRKKTRNNLARQKSGFRAFASTQLPCGKFGTFRLRFQSSEQLHLSTPICFNASITHNNTTVLYCLQCCNAGSQRRIARGRCPVGAS